MLSDNIVKCNRDQTRFRKYSIWFSPSLSLTLSSEFLPERRWKTRELAWTKFYPAYLKVDLKGQCHESFKSRGFKVIFTRPLPNISALKIFSKFCEDICNSRCTIRWTTPVSTKAQFHNFILPIQIKLFKNFKFI